MPFINTLDIIKAMQTALTALQLPGAYSAVAGYPNAFQSTGLYPNADFIQALEDLYNYDDRVCLIVPAGDTHDDSTQGTNLFSRRTTSIQLLIGDQDFSKSQAQTFGGPSAVGVVALKDLVINSLFGSNLGISGIALTPENGEPLHISFKEKQQAPDRDCWQQTFKTPAGLGKAPIIRGTQ
jgi:hypothetical protein